MSKELEREAATFKYVRSLKPSVASDTALLKLAAILTHNVGDVDQGLNYWQVRVIVWCKDSDPSTAMLCAVLHCTVLYCTVSCCILIHRRSLTDHSLRPSPHLLPYPLPSLPCLQTNADGVSAFESHKRKFSRLAHERNDRFGGEFFRAKIIYKELLSAEGHRHYPLREPKCLRTTPDLMLPLGAVLVTMLLATQVHIYVVP
jgi:hypothetical protein